MGVSFEKFSFTKSTSTSVPVAQEINLSGAFQPKALILWCNNATGTTFAEHRTMSLGFSDGTDDAVVTATTEDNAGSSIRSNVCRNDSIISLYNESTQAELSRASVTSFDSDGFTLSWSINGTGNVAAIVHGIAIGGTDITNVDVILPTVGTTSTGNQSYTNSGFEPDFAFMIGDWDSYNVVSTTSNNVIAGCAISTTKRWTIDGNSEGATNMDTWAYHTDSEAMAMLSNTGAVDWEADFVSFNADGITLNFTVAPSFDTDALPMLLIQGGQWDVGTFIQPDATGDQNVATSGIDTHKGAMFFCHGLIESTVGTAQSHNRLSIGGADGTRQGYATYHDTDAVGTSVITKIQNTDGIVRNITANATAGSSTTESQASFSSFSSNQFTVNWGTVADTTDRIVSWFAVGEAGAAVAPTDVRRPLHINVTRFNVQWSKNVRPTIRVFGARFKDLIENFTRRYLKRWVSFSNPILARLVGRSSILHQDSIQLMQS